ncbi:Trehalose-binding lipoprotein LpqY [Austwickia sp. TVS 96-490-7B]|uniref:extracellular solute-binding protein n=1 Tax=Austwickia sp. TVS 96-490-7B TaxID=2830843 RepID=UPI001D9B601B|nr:extracellular solute-binding protein [Austwickia sp. TVS 96-490-7B]MBW3085869.1 Trehalose-binding lipoprotein LpqY [Austwickia sp. TVS 96-490-7B]
MAGTRTSTRAFAATMVGAAALGMLPSCGSPQEDTTRPTQLTWYINPDNGGNDPSKSGQAHLAQTCSQASGGSYTITTQLLPNSASDQRQQLLRRLAASDAGVDIMSLDTVFVAEFAQADFLDAVPVDRRQAFTDDVVAPAVESATWKDTLYAAPFWANTQLLWYRKSVAAQAGLDMTKPVTWDQIIDAATSQRKTVGVQAKPYEGYTVWINALTESAGGHLVTNPGASADDLNLGLTDQAGRRAAHIINRIADSGVGGPALSSSDENTTVDLFAGATSGFMVQWPYVWAALPLKGVDMADVGYARYPQIDQGRQSRPPLGGIQLAVNSRSRAKGAAWDAVRCLTDAAQQKTYMLGAGNPAARKSVYDDAQVRDAFPMAPLIKESLDSGAARPSSQFYGDISGGLYKSFSPPHDVDPSTTPQDAQRFIRSVVRGEALL